MQLGKGAHHSLGPVRNQMERAMLIELMGYLGSALVVISMLMTSANRLRIINATGAGIFTLYAWMIHSYPTALMNFAIVLIDIYNLFRLHKTKQEGAG